MRIEPAPNGMGLLIPPAPRVDTGTMPIPDPPSAPVVSRASCFVRLSESRGVLTARLAGPGIAEREASILSNELGSAVADLGRRLRRLVIDLADVEMISSMGLGMLIDIRGRAFEHGARTVLCGLSPELESLIRMTKVDQLYMIARSNEELTRAVAV